MKVMSIPELDGPYRPSRRQYVISAIAHGLALVAIGTLSAIAFLGMSGWL